MITRYVRRTAARAVLFAGLGVAALGGAAAAQSRAATAGSPASFYASPSTVVKDANGYAVFDLIAHLGVGKRGVLIASSGLSRACASTSLGPNGEDVWLDDAGSASVGVSAQGCRPGTYAATLQRGSVTYRTAITIRG